MVVLGWCQRGTRVVLGWNKGGNRAALGRRTDLLEPQLLPSRRRVKVPDKLLNEWRMRRGTAAVMAPSTPWHRFGCAVRRGRPCTNYAVLCRAVLCCAVLWCLGSQVKPKPRTHRQTETTNASAPPARTRKHVRGGRNTLGLP